MKLTTKAKQVLETSKGKFKSLVLSYKVDSIDHAEFAGMLWMFERDKDKKVINMRCHCRICGLRVNAVENDSCDVCESVIPEPGFIASFLNDEIGVVAFIEDELDLMRAGKKRFRTDFQKEFLYWKYDQPRLTEERTGSFASLVFEV